MTWNKVIKLERDCQAWFGFINSSPPLSSSNYSHINTVLTALLLLVLCWNNGIFVVISDVSQIHQLKAQKLSQYPSIMLHIFRKIPTKHRTAKSKSGRAERMRSHRHPRVGITNTARRTSNTVPIAQKTCQREKKQSEMRMRMLLRHSL